MQLSARRYLTGCGGISPVCSLHVPLLATVDVFGSADLSATLTRHGLFDEFRIALVPVTLGEGGPLFKADSEPLRLQLVES